MYWFTCALSTCDHYSAKAKFTKCFHSKMLVLFKCSCYLRYRSYLVESIQRSKTLDLEYSWLKERSQSVCQLVRPEICSLPGYRPTAWICVFLSVLENSLRIIMCGVCVVGYTYRCYYRIHLAAKLMIWYCSWESYKYSSIFETFSLKYSRMNHWEVL